MRTTLETILLTIIGALLGMCETGSDPSGVEPSLSQRVQIEAMLRESLATPVPRSSDPLGAARQLYEDLWRLAPGPESTRATAFASLAASSSPVATRAAAVLHAVSSREGSEATLRMLSARSPFAVDPHALALLMHGGSTTFAAASQRTLAMATRGHRDGSRELSQLLGFGGEDVEATLQETMAAASLHHLTTRPTTPRAIYWQQRMMTAWRLHDAGERWFDLVRSGTTDLDRVTAVMPEFEWNKIVTVFGVYVGP